MRTLQAGVILMAFLLSACGTAVEPGPQAGAAPFAVPPEYAGLTGPSGPEAADEGSALYRQNCEMCHGEDGRGDGPAGASLIPPPADLHALNATAADDYLYWRIAEGKPGTGMFAWKGILPEDDLWKLVAYIRTLK